MKRADIFVIAVWTAFIFGLAEGLVLNASRANPVLFAPYKLSAHVIWVAPIIDIAIFLITACLLMLLFMLIPERYRGPFPDLVFGIFLFLGFFAVLFAPKILHVASVVLLSLGLAIVSVRLLRRGRNKITESMRRSLILVPVLMLFTAGIISGYERLQESRIMSRLPEAETDAQNVLIIVMDTVRFDRFLSTFMSSTGNSVTPNLNQLAKKGVRYENAWVTSSWSLPSHASILTGLYPHEHGADWPELELKTDVTTLPEYFSNLGYVTAAFSGNSAWVTPEYLGRGFTRFKVYTAQDFIRRTSYGRALDLVIAKLGFHYSGYGKKAPQLHDEFLDFLADFPENPFFGYITYMDVNQAFHKVQLGHAFWEQPPTTQEVIKAYDESLSVLDQQIGDFFLELERKGVLENTLVVITSDHGESFGATNADDHDPEGHGTSLYPEQSHVPLFIIYPQEIEGNQRIDDTVSLRSIAGTITGLLNLDNTPFVGELLPLNQSSETIPEQDTGLILATLNYDKYQVQSVIWDSWLYLKDLNQAEGKEELYNLDADPEAKVNLIAHPEVTASIRQKLEQLLASRHISGN
jgi:arylsulfatase A-like enzyme